MTTEIKLTTINDCINLIKTNMEADIIIANIYNFLESLPEQLKRYDDTNQHICKIWSIEDIKDRYQNIKADNPDFTNLTNDDLYSIFSDVVDRLSDCTDDDWFIIDDAILNY